MTVLALAGLLLAGEALRAAPVPPGCWLRDAAAAGETVWLLCEDGPVLKSADRGETWSHFQLPAAGRWHAVALVDEERAAVAGAGGQLLTTEDGGHTWARRESGAADDLFDITFVGESGWAVGDNGLILHSDDGGLSWARQASFTRSRLLAVFFLNEKTGWAAGWTGTLLRTRDGGGFWEQVELPGVYGNLNDIWFQDADNGWAVGTPGLLLRTRDGGRSWQLRPPPAGGVFRSIRFDARGRGFLAGDRLLVSEDGGETWMPAGLETREALVGVLPVRDEVWVFSPHELHLAVLQDRSRTAVISQAVPLGQDRHLPENQMNTDSY